MPDSFSRIRERRSKGGRAITIALKQVKRDPLCRLLAHTGHATQCVDQANE
jgi:hypothetical protein